uniref:Uncharacterized protein n=1 Tax=Hucho hucho TaxID=62062 RepID=A0A4W5L7U0_9TELE
MQQCIPLRWLPTLSLPPGPDDASCSSSRSRRSSHPTYPAHAPPPHSAHPTHSTDMSMLLAPSHAAASNHQQELQAKLLSLFNSGAGASASAASPAMAPQAYGSTMSIQSTGLPMSPKWHPHHPKPPTLWVPPQCA